MSFLCRGNPVKPTWLPPECIWSHPTKKNGTVEGAAMTSQEFLINQKAVLRAAYVFVGINPDTHISAEHYLSKNQKKEEPFRLPLKAKLKTFPAKNITGNTTAIPSFQSVGYL